jgi:hypothetical protein
MKRADKKKIIDAKKPSHISSSDMIEREWTDAFGDRFEVRLYANGRLYSRSIVRDPIRGWTVAWDEVRASVRQAALGNVSASASGANHGR